MADRLIFPNSTVIFEVGQDLWITSWTYEQNTSHGWPVFIHEI